MKDDSGKEKWRTLFTERERYHAWETALQHYVLTTESSEVRDFFISKIRTELEESKNFFSEAIKFLHLVTEPDLHNSEWARYKDPELLATIQNRAVEFTESFKEPETNYLFSLAARAEGERIKSSKPVEWFRGKSDLYDWMPLLVNDHTYGVVFENSNGQPQLIVAPSDETEKISTLLKELETARPAYEDALDRKQAILDRYEGVEEANLPYSVYDELREYSTEEKTYLALEHKVRSYFFDEDPTGHGLGSFSGTARTERVVQSEDFLPAHKPTGVLNKEDGVRQQVYFSQLIRKEIEKDLGTSLGALSLREQFYFFKVVRERTIENIEPVKAFARIYGAEAFRTFLSLEHDQGLGDEIIAFGNRTDPETARAIFERYGEILDAAEQTREIFIQAFGKKTASLQSQGSLADGLAKRGKDILLGAVRTPRNVPDVLLKLGSVNTDAIVFANAFRTLKENNELDLEAIRNTSLETESSAEFRTHLKDVAKVEELFVEAYKNQPEGFRKAVIDSFHKSLSNPDTRFYALRRKDEVIASLRFDDIKNEKSEVIERYFGSFVSDAAYGNGKLGEAVFENAIKKESAVGTSIRAHCNPLAPITQKYIEAGFVATDLDDYAGVPSFSIVLDIAQNRDLKTKTWSTEKIVEASLNQNSKEIKAFSTKDKEDIPFDMVKQGYALTRYMEKDKLFYAVFELLPAGEKTSA